MAKINSTVLWLSIGALLLYAVVNPANASPAGNNTISDSQLQQTGNLEGFSASAYADGSDSSGRQLYSIGYGHQVKSNESELLLGSITEEQGQQLLLSDMQKVITAINNSGQTFTQGQFDALCDFGYNAGILAMQKVISTFASSGADAAAAEMQKYIYWHPVPGGAAVVNQDLVNRRNIEVSTWNS